MSVRFRGKLTRENYDRRLPHRCCKCKTRRTLAKRWSLYIRKPACHVCGHYRLKPCFDRLAQNWGRKHRCNCEGYHHPHRRGSKYCERNSNYERHAQERAEAHA